METLNKILPNTDVNKFNELMDSTYELAKKLLPFLARRRIPLTPYNYRLFYDYFMANNPELNRQLNNILQSESLFTSSISQQLYHEFYDLNTDKAEALTKVGERIGSISQVLEQNLGKSLDSTGRYHKMLADTANQMEDTNLEPYQLKDLLGSLLLETQTALTTQSDLAAHIEKTNKIITALTTELKDQTRLANIDELTQLFNRRYLSQNFTKLKEECGDKLLLSLLLFDLDRFKSINDTWGHNTGDKVLILCAKIIQNHAGEKYFPIRYGGEEFIILCPELDATGAVELAESVRRQVAATQITLRGQNVPVTISCGVSQYIEGEQENDFISRADQALYKAKDSGRNCVVVAE